MPFGLCNAPAAFQRLMQRVLMGLNPEESPNFLVVYLDDVLVFSETLEDHLRHLQTVIKRLEEAGLKRKPAKCQFDRQGVEYLEHIITPDGLKPNPNHVAAVRASYYWRFIQKFTEIAQPLHQLTKKGVPFDWTAACLTAFDRASLSKPLSWHIQTSIRTSPWTTLVSH